MNAARLKSAVDRLTMHIEAKAAIDKAFVDARGLPEFIATAIEREQDFKLQRYAPPVAVTRETMSSLTINVFTYRVVIRPDLALRFVCIETGTIVYEVQNLYGDY